MTPEEYVRSVWQKVYVHEQRSVKEAPSQWHGYVIVDTESSEMMISSGNLSERWCAAAEFTHQRMEEIRKLKREIAWMVQLLPTERTWQSVMDYRHPPERNQPYVEFVATGSRILQRLEAELRRLTAGIKPEAL